MIISYILKKKLIGLTIILFCLSLVLFSQENQLLSKEVTGKITYLNTPLPNVNIIIKGTQKGTKTNTQGLYTIKANVGDVIQYSYVGFNTVSIVVEDVTTVLNIEMDTHVSELDEVVLTTRNKVEKITDFHEVMDIDLQTSFGTINPLKSASAVHYLGNRSLRHISSPSLEDALSGRFSKVEKKGDRLYIRDVPAHFDIDGMLFERDPGVIFSNIEHLFIMKDKALVIVRTKNSFEVLQKKKEEVTEKHKNQNYYNDDAVTVQNETTFSSNTVATQNTKVISKDIHGKVTYIDAPLANVNIIIVGKTIGTKTNTQGNYNIKVAVGDIIQYKYIGFKTVSIVVEDVTEILNIKMFTQTNLLEEVVVTAKIKSGKVLERAIKAEEKFVTSRGTINPKNATYPISFIDGDDIKPIYSSLTQALNGKMAGVSIDRNTGKIMVKPFASINTPMFAIWDVDGQIFTEEPPLDLNNIKSVHILKTLSGTNRYGSQGAGGVIVVTTKYGSFDAVEAKRKKIAEQYTNKNYYSNDASVVNIENLNSNTFADALEAFNNKQKAFIYYDQTLKNRVKSYSDHISIAQKFITFYKDENLAREVFNKVTETYNKNPEILKAVAFHLQALGFKKEAVKVYKQVFKLRPKYVQSYRDLANAYTENEQFKKAWRLYMSYLMQGNDVSGEGIGQILYNEMEWLYFNRKNQTAIKEQFVPLSEDIIDFRNDVRLVFEWNTSEAEFDLEFVSPDLRAYVFEHSLANNQELITDEKEKGYSSKSYFIDDLGKGEWLVNLSYKGNKKPEPTYFKFTCYYNWGKPNQEKVITVYRLYEQRNKMQLLKLNKQLLVAVN